MINEPNDMYQKIRADRNIDSIFFTLKKYGIALVPAYISKNELSQLKDEFTKSFSYNGKGFSSKHTHPTNKDGMVVRVVREQLNDDDFPAIKAVFGSTLMYDITKRYYAPYDFRLNEDVFLTHEKPCDIPILPWHFDRVQSLKFFIYLKDTSKNDGAFEYVPGSHREGRYRANYHLATGTALQQLPNDIPDDEIINPVTMEGKAGDLIIFDPDGFHRGGIVGEGGERMVMRGHCHPHPVFVSYGKPKMFSKNWWVQSKFNFSVRFQDKYSRILGSEIKSKAIKDRDDNQDNLLGKQQ